MEEPHFTSPLLKDFHPAAYHFFGLWKQNVFSMGFWVSCWDKEVVDRLGLHAEETGSLMLHEGNFFIKQSEIDSIKRQVFEKIAQHDEAFFLHMRAAADELHQSSSTWAEKNKNQAVSADVFEQFLKQARRINFLWLLGAEQLSIAAEESFQQAVVEENLPAEIVPSLVPKVITPLTHQHHEMLALKEEIGEKMLDQVREDVSLYVKLQEHSQRYAWIEIANFVGTPLSPERLYEQIVHAKSERTEEESAHPVSDEVSFRARCMSHCGYIKQAGAEYFFMFSEKMLPFLRRIAEMLHLSYEEFLFLREVEVLEALQGRLGEKELREIIARRQGMNLVLFGSNDGVVCVEEPRDIELLKKSMLPAVSTTEEIRGQIGNKGIYRGPVRIVMNAQDFHKMQPGEVLVSTMTTPDFVILMQKAGAIVTDIGGMLCHAAIVSREINKPCIIGTKNATKILKDGDMVEVDAEKGIVRKI